MASRFLLSGWRGKRGPLLGKELNLLKNTPSSKRCVSSQTKRGSGGRSSFSGVVATVFGATGFIGRYVVNRLGRMGSQVVVPYRGDEHDYRHLCPMGDLGQIVFREFNLKDPESVEKVVRHSNVVINLVGRDYETRNFKFEDVHVDGARTIAEACLKCNVERLIHFSALNADQEASSKFLQSKGYGEEVVQDIFPEATIVRPADVYGHEDRFLNYYARLKSMPFGILPMLNGGVGIIKRPVYVGDVASAVMQMINDPSVKLCELVGPQGFELRELVEYIYHVMYRSCTIVTPPPVLYRAAAFILEQNPFVPYLTRDLLKRLHLSNTPTSNVAGLEDLGVTPARLEDKAITFLRMYRGALVQEKPIEDTHPSHTAQK